MCMLASTIVFALCCYRAWCIYCRELMNQVIVVLSMHLYGQRSQHNALFAPDVGRIDCLLLFPLLLCIAWSVSATGKCSLDSSRVASAARVRFMCSLVWWERSATGWTSLWWVIRLNNDSLPIISYSLSLSLSLSRTQHTRTHGRTHARIHRHTHASTDTRTHPPTHASTDTRTHTHTYTHTHTHTHAHTLTHTHTHTHTHMCIHQQLCAYAHSPPTFFSSLFETPPSLLNRHKKKFVISWLAFFVYRCVCGQHVWTHVNIMM